MATPDEVTVWIGLDVGKEEHFADVLDDHGDPLFAKSIGNDEADLVGLLDRAFEHGTPALVIDQPGSIASSPLPLPPVGPCRSHTCPASS